MEPVLMNEDPVQKPPVCGRCGAALVVSAAEGLCPGCLLKDGLNLLVAGHGPARASGTANSETTDCPRLRYFGDYELLAEIARGGMGVVYKARQVRLNRLVAVKMILSAQFAGPAGVRRFQAEARAAATLQHPHIVAIHEIGEHEGQHYFSMDYVEGRDLGDLVRDGPLPARRAATLVQTIAEAIHCAHQQGVLHRDLKPSNILIDRNDQPHVTDFGLAKRFGVPPSGGAGTREPAEAGTPNEITLTGQVFGTPAFMPPEQAGGRRREVGVPSDVYSLGAVLFFLLTGRAPFIGETMEDTLHQVLTREAVTPRLLNPGVPRDLETICLKCLEKNPARRYPSAEDLADELGRFLRDEPIQARPIAPAEKLGRWCRRHPAIASLGSVVAILLATIAVVSSVSAVRLKTSRDQARNHLRQAETNLWDAYFAQAQARRWSSRMGRRFEALDALHKAAAIRPSLGLRNEAIACLALPDFRVRKEWEIKANRNDAHCFAPDYERIAVSDGRGNFSVRRLSDGQELFSLPGFQPQLGCQFSPDGRSLAGASKSNRIEVWNLERREAVLHSPDRKVRNFSFSPDGRRIALVFRAPGMASQIEIHDLDSQKLPDSFEHPFTTPDLFFSPAGDRMAVSSVDGTRVEVRDVATWQVEKSFDAPAGIYGLAWHPEGVLLAAAGADRQVHLWNTTTGKPHSVLSGHQMEVTGVLFNRSGQLMISGSWDGNIRVWDVRQGRHLFSLPMPAGVSPFSLDDRLLAGMSGLTTATLFDVATARECQHLINLAAPAQSRFGELSPDGRLLAACDPGGAVFWDVEAAREMAFLPEAGIHGFLFHPQGDRFFVCSDSGLKEWPMKFTGSNSLTFGPPQLLSAPGYVRRCFLDRSGNLLGFPQKGLFHVIDLASRKEVSRLPHPRTNDIFALSPDARLVAAWKWFGGTVDVWDIATTNKLATLPATYTTCTFTPDGRWLVTGDKKQFRFWNTRNWTCERSLVREGDPDYPGWVAITRDGSVMAAAHSRTLIRLYQTETGEELATLEPPDPQMIDWLAFSADGRRLAVTCKPQGTIVWDLGLIRQQLAAMKLDWNLPPLPSSPTNRLRAPFVTTVLGPPAATNFPSR